MIVDDGGYGMLRFDQRRSGAATYGVDLHTPDFVALAESFGVRAEAVDGLERRVLRGARAATSRDPEPTRPRRPRGARAAADDVAALVSPGGLSARPSEPGASPLIRRSRAKDRKTPLRGRFGVRYRHEFGLPRNFP